ncbi:MAG: hypothetical protein OXJ52_06150 [Oligoflexia bacterium]|nr:hypothetical protein [Oligoflexia bacterium]
MNFQVPTRLLPSFSRGQAFAGVTKERKAQTKSVYNSQKFIELRLF